MGLLNLTTVNYQINSITSINQSLFSKSNWCQDLFGTSADLEIFQSFFSFHPNSSLIIFLISFSLSLFLLNFLIMSSTHLLNHSSLTQTQQILYLLFYQINCRNCICFSTIIQIRTS